MGLGEDKCPVCGSYVYAGDLMSHKGICCDCAQLELEILEAALEQLKQKHSLPLAGEIAEDGTIRFD